MQRYTFTLILVFVQILCLAQTKTIYTTANAHSHNDYEQVIPFYLAYNQQFGSVEADIYSRNDTLFVAHERSGMKAGRTLENLYLEPLKEAIAKNNGQLFKDKNQELQLLIDLKTSWKETMPVLVRKLSGYEDILYPKGPVHIVLSGNNPPAEDFTKYPAFIRFDGRPNIQYTPEQLEKIGLISQAFGSYTQWNGKGVLTKTDKEKVAAVIAQVHAKGKKIRFWATPDDINAWKMMMNLGVDYLNTDKVEALGKYLRERSRAEFTQLRPHEIYKPTYKNNDSRSQVDHVILLIGDGMGLTQIYSGITANHGQLNLGQFLNIGFSKTNASDSYITDSAAGATAMATGKKTRNRAIGVDSTFKAVPALPDKLRPLGVKTALISSGDITDATPASFYAHQPYREMQKEIAHDYLRSSMDILIGGGQGVFENEKVADSLRLKGAQFSTDWADLSKMKSPFVLLNDSKVVSVEKGRGEFLIPALNKVLGEFKSNKSGSFIMAEGAQIDYGGHANQVSYVVTEMLDFDRLVGEALKFADSNGRTLVIVTADHETGGLTLLDGNLKRGYVDGQFSTNDHTAVMVPVFAYGPHSLDFRGVYENTEIFERILKVFEKYRK